MLGRLISEVGAHSSYYSYDISGNRTGVIVDTATVICYNYNANGELVSETSNNGSVSETTAYEYDLNGNLTKKTKGFSVTDYTYNAWNQMVSAGNVTYTYNAQGLRVSKSSSGETDTFTLVGGNVWSDSESKYLRGIELIASDTQIYLYNIRGDVIQLLGFDGEVDKTYDYDAYGNEYSRDLADENPFRYCGEYYDTETGFIYLRARYYDPTVGRFTTLDPIKDGLNWYNYCNNNPVNFVDPNGLKPLPNWLYKLLCAISGKKFNSNNYDLNSNFKLPYPLGNYAINDQTLASIGFMRYGNYPENGTDDEKKEYTLATNGCGVVAIYNIMFLKDQRQELYDIASYLEKNGHIIDNGKYGTNPFTIGEYFDEKNIADGDLMIVSTWNSNKKKDGVHFFAIEYRGGTYYAYNFGYEKEAFETQDINDLLLEDMFVTAYLF